MEYVRYIVEGHNSYYYWLSQNFAAGKSRTFDGHGSHYIAGGSVFTSIRSSASLLSGQRTIIAAEFQAMLSLTSSVDRHLQQSVNCAPQYIPGTRYISIDYVRRLLSKYQTGIVATRCCVYGPGCVKRYVMCPLEYVREVKICHGASEAIGCSYLST